ncbi:MAG: PEP-CTERM sorting domain-containing protein [Planctomycetota bacterium]
MTLALAACAALGLSGAAFASPVPWSQPDGSTANFDYSGGQSDNGLFGDPIVTDEGLIFTPVGFIASATDGGAQVTSDRLQVTITAPDGQDIDQISVTELGDYAILGSGSVFASGALFAVGEGLPLAGIADALDVDPAMPILVESSGLYEGTATLEFPEGITEVTLVFNNILQAEAGPNSSALIQKKTAGFDIDIVIPEPASVGLLGVAGLGLLRRRNG